MQTYHTYRGPIIGVGLDSHEVGNPAEKFTNAFRQAAQLSLRAVAHAGKRTKPRKKEWMNEWMKGWHIEWKGEEGGPDYVWGALNALNVQRIDHGVHSADDSRLMAHLRENRIALTMCPYSNCYLKVFASHEENNIYQLYKAGIKVTINSDDPAYFGGHYIGDNFFIVQQTFNLSVEELYDIAKNSFEASFISDDVKKSHLQKLAEWKAQVWPKHCPSRVVYVTRQFKCVPFF